MEGNGEDPIKKERQKGRERNDSGGGGIQSGAESGERAEAALTGRLAPPRKEEAWGSACGEWLRKCHGRASVCI